MQKNFYMLLMDQDAVMGERERVSRHLLFCYTLAIDMEISLVESIK